MRENKLVARDAVCMYCGQQAVVMVAEGKGMCIQCCIGIPAPGRKSCPKCLERAREYARMKRAEKKSTI